MYNSNTLKFFILHFILLFTSFCVSSQTISLNSAWTKQGSTVKPLIVKGSVTGDVNGDGNIDFVAQPNLLNLGNNTSFFSQSPNDWGINSTYNGFQRHGYLGDHNGDGKKDVVLIKNNQIAVFNGSNTGLPLEPSQLFNISNCDACGFDNSFDGNGDINNDGYDDLIIGAPLKMLPDGSRGAVYIYYGSATGLNFNAPTLIDWNYFGTHLGTQVRYAGDVNKDGFDDILIATETIRASDFDEHVYIVYGKTGVLAPPLSIGLAGRDAEDYAHEIGAVGDINGDGFADFYISAAGRYAGSPFLKGKVEIVFGSAVGVVDDNILQLMPPSNEEEGVFGKSVCSAGDFNDDGYSDLAVTFNDKVLIYLGAQRGFSPVPRYSFSTCCAPTIRYAGDVDKDGFHDLLVGEQDYNSGAGRVQLLRGRPSMIPNFGAKERDLCLSNPRAVFQDSSLETVSQIWDFGDGTQSTLKNPVHTYTRGGIFNVKLTTKDLRGHSWTTIKDSFIIVRAPMAAGDYIVGAGEALPDVLFLNKVCKCGIAGNVQLKFKNGIYAPPTLRLENIETQGFTLTLESLSGNRDSVQFGPLFRYPYNWTAQPNLIINNSKNIKFKNLYFERAPRYVEPSIQMSNSENVKFENCIFTMNEFVNALDPIMMAQNVKNVQFEGCTFSSSFPLLTFNQCVGLTISKSNGRAAVYIDSSQNILCTQSNGFYFNIKDANTIKIEKSSRIEANISKSGKVEIAKNEDDFSMALENVTGFKIHKNKHPTSGSYFLKGVTGLDTEGYNLITNNIVFPIYVVNSRNVKIYQNSLFFKSIQDVSCKGINLRVQNSDSIDVRNNLFLQVQVENTECSFVQIDNNQRYTANFNAYCNNRFFNTDVFNAHYLLSFQEFKDAVGQDRNSVLGAMKMNMDLLAPDPSTAGLINAAAPLLTEVSDDINGRIRLQSGVDMGALEFDAPNYRDFSVDSLKTSSFDIGNNPISVLFTNRSGSIADSCRFAYQVNDNPIVHEKWTGRLNAFTPMVYTFSTPLSITKGKVYTVKIWLENALEATRQNDTLVKTMILPMAGIYSIGNNADFKGVVEFFNDLETADTKGDVTGVLQTGHYSFVDPTMYRTNAQNHWLTLKGDETNRDNVHLTFDFIDQRYLRFEDLTLDIPDMSINAIKFGMNNCVVKSVQNALNKRYRVDLNVDSSVVVQNSEFTNLSYGLRITGSSFPYRNPKTLIENSRFYNVDTAIYIAYVGVTHLNIRKNTIDTAQIGLYFDNIASVQGIDSSTVTVTQNRIVHCNEVGIKAQQLDHFLFANNFVQGNNASFELVSFRFGKIVNNSCFGTFKLVYDNWYSYAFNNSFVAQDTPMIAHLSHRPEIATHFNFNNYFSLNNKPFKIADYEVDDRVSEMNLANLKQNFQMDTLSISANPRYRSMTDMHIDTLSPLNGAGGGIFFNVKTDIDGQERDIVRNDIGADEIKTPSVVMPGDANFDGVVNMFDLVSLGIALPQQLRGTPRVNPSIEWLPQASTDWSDYVLGKNAKHIDTNGDGIINADDTLAISRNFSKTHIYYLGTRSVLPLLYLSNLPTAATEGNWVTTNINLGTISERASDVYGLLFSIQYDTSKIKAGSLSLNFDTCWLGQNNQRLTMTKDFGRMNVGIVRTTGTNISGNGVIAKLRFQLKDAVLGKTQITLSDAVLLNNNGIKQDLAAKMDTFIVKLKTPTSEIGLENTQLDAFPNPTKDIITLKRKGNTDNSPCFWVLYDIVGRQINKGVFYSESTNISLLTYPTQQFVLKTLLNGKMGVYKLAKTL